MQRLVGPDVCRVTVRSLVMSTGQRYAVWVDCLTREQTITLMRDQSSILGRLGLGLGVASVEYLVFDDVEGNPLMLIGRENETSRTYSIRVAGLDQKAMHDLVRALEHALRRERENA